MALANYSDLQTSVANWLHRSDLTSLITDFIALAEAKLNRTLRLRTMESDNTLTLSSGTRTVALPSGFLEPISLEIVINGEPNEGLTDYYRQPQQLDINSASGSATRPRYWAINGTNIEFENLADQTYSLTFRMVTAFALSVSSTTNWLLTNHPDLYLYGTLLQAAPYIRDDVRIATWKSFYDDAFDEVKRNAARTKSKVPLTTDLPGSHTRQNIITDS